MLGKQKKRTDAEQSEKNKKKETDSDIATQANLAAMMMDQAVLKNQQGEAVAVEGLQEMKQAPGC